MNVPLQKILPKWIVRTLQRVRDHYTLIRIANNHKKEVARLKNKEKLRVVFLVIHKNVWKLDTVFREMLTDARFDPKILVCPQVNYGDEEMYREMNECYDYFFGKSYPVQMAYDKETEAWVDVSSDVSPDIVFFTNPHDLTRPEYYRPIFEKYLSCYVPYAHQVSRYGDYQDQYNQLFHNAMWLLFAPHKYDKDISTKVAQNKGRNVVVSGYPALEDLYNRSNLHLSKSAWKQQEKTKKRIIWAPHHTIDTPSLPYANFLKFAELFKRYAREYSSSIQWAFKPHPLLRAKLHRHKDWGSTKTDEYYEFWSSSNNTQFEDGDYLRLFEQSDAMIHDSGSFLAEYLYTLKPVMYLVAVDNLDDYFNEFGRSAFEACYHGNNEEDITGFIEMLLAKDDPMETNRRAFIEAEIAPFFEGKSPTTTILAEIKNRLLR